MKGILLKPYMIKATVEGRKTETRRLIKPEPFRLPGTRDLIRWQPKGVIDINMRDNSDLAIPYARYHAGETVYIKEAHIRYGSWYQFDNSWIFDPEPNYLVYYSDDNAEGLEIISGYSTESGWYRRSPMFLPEKFARYFIKIKSVRPERLQEITDGGAKREGVTRPPLYSLAPNYRAWYQYLWDSINKKNQWKDNPWVFVYSFEKVDKSVSMGISV